MDLKKLFSVQKVLRDRINYNESDRFDKLVLALLVEVGELAQEWRGFKFWSKDQEPRTRVPSTAWGEPYKNPLLEEYADGFTFIIELGIELGFENAEYWGSNVFERENTTLQFTEVFNQINGIAFCKRVDSPTIEMYESLINNYIILGEMLGFRPEEIEAAYMDKNAINHKRQDSGTY